jgi:NitT/TauT family transport system permease protein
VPPTSSAWRNQGRGECRFPAAVRGAARASGEGRAPSSAQHRALDAVNRALLAFWYFGTKYRWDFYLRFTNIPTPAEVLATRSVRGQ